MTKKSRVRTPRKERKFARVRDVFALEEKKTSPAASSKACKAGGSTVTVHGGQGRWVTVQEAARLAAPPLISCPAAGPRR